MKRKNTYIYAVLFITIAASTQVQAQKMMDRYLVKSAVVTMKHTGMSEGTETIYIDNYGEKIARYTELKTTVMGFSSTEKELELTLGNEVYTIDLTNNTGTKSTLPVTEMSKKEMKEWAEWGEEMMEEMGFEKTGQEKILGKTCDIWEGMGTRSWIWKNMALKTEVNMMGKTTIEATEMKIDVNIPASKFKVPEGIDFEVVDVSDEESSEANMEDLEESLNQLKGLLGTKKKK